MKLAAYVPSESQGYLIPDDVRNDILDRVKSTFAHVYGGYTATDSVGGWVNDDGKLIEELVTVVYTFTDNPDIYGLRSIARMVCNRLGQDAVAIEHSGGMEFVTFPTMEVEVR